MARKTATPDEISQALAMREAGYTVLSISQKLGISIRSLHRHFAEYKTKKGAVKEELVTAARAEILKRVTSDETIKEEAAKLINDDLAHARHLRNVVLEASDKLEANSLKDAVLVMRAAAAYSTAIKNTSDLIRQTLRFERITDSASDDLPELVITELTQEQIEIMRSEQNCEDELCSIAPS